MVVLHEDVVPDFNPAFVGGVVLRGGGGAIVRPVENLGVRATWSVSGHGRPPVVLSREKGNTLVGNSEGAPKVGGCIVWSDKVVAFEDSNGEARWGDVEDLGEEFPAPRDGFGLEVVAKTPVAKHFEECVMGFVAYFVKVSHTEAFLEVDQAFAAGWMRCSGEVGDKWLHSCGDEEGRGIVFGQDGCAVDARVGFFDEEVDEFLFDVDGHGETPSD